MGKIHDVIDVLDYKRNITGETNLSERTEINSLFTEELVRFWEYNLTNIFRRDKDIRVADSVLHLFRIKQNLENFNKKALYIMIREMTNVPTSKITQVSNVFRRIYPRVQREILTKGHIENLTITGSI